jgi:two-component system cell cycle response regulator
MTARILVIEDHPINLELMSYLLHAWGHRTLIAADGDEGLAVAQRERPDLIVCDIQMPGLDGYGVARALKADPELRHIPIIAVTAFAMVGDREKALAAGFDGHVSKPIDPAAFMAVLRPFLPDESHGEAMATAAPPAAAPSIPAELRAPTPGLTLLLVDDTESNLEFKLLALEPAGYAVLSARSMEVALAMLRSQRVDLVVCDVMMRGGDGFELLARLRAEAAWHALPFMFLTASARDPASQRRGLELGANAYVLRPIEPEPLLAEIRACLLRR